MRLDRQLRIFKLFEAGKYACSDRGEVLGFSNNHQGFREIPKVLKPSFAGTSGYPRVVLIDEHGRLDVLVHHVVVIFFKGCIPRGHVVDHLNSKIDDSSPENLEVVTVKENNRRAALKWTRKHCPKTGRILKCVP